MLQAKPKWWFMRSLLVRYGNLLPPDRGMPSAQPGIVAASTLIAVSKLLDWKFPAIKPISLVAFDKMIDGRTCWAR